MLNLDQRQIGVELHTDMLHESRFRPLLDAGATFVIVRETRDGKWLHTDDAGTYSTQLSTHTPTFLSGIPEEWDYSMTASHAGMIAPEWPYGHAAYFLANLNEPDPHVRRAVEDDSRHAMDMHTTVPGSMIGRYVSSLESISDLKRLETDFLILRGDRTPCFAGPETQLLDSILKLSRLPILVHGIETGESAALAMETGARGVIISSQSLSVELVSEVKNSLGG